MTYVKIQIEIYFEKKLTSIWLYIFLKPFYSCFDQNILFFFENGIFYLA